jgi:hypothetical protein
MEFDLEALSERLFIETTSRERERVEALCTRMWLRGGERDIKMMSAYC